MSSFMRLPAFTRGGPALLLAGVITAGAGLALASRSHAEDVRPVPAPAVDEATTSAATTETAILAGGCFWGVQRAFTSTSTVSRAPSRAMRAATRARRITTMSAPARPDTPNR